MTMMKRTHVFAAAVFAAGCSGLLDVNDPDVLNPEDLASPSAAVAARNGAILRLTTATTGQNSDNIFLMGGLLADEWRSGDTFEQRNTTDQRTLVPENTFLDELFRDIMRVRTQTQVAINLTRQFEATNTSAVAQMFAMQAYAAVLLGEHFCNGIPFSRLNGTEIVFGSPVSVDSAFGIAMAEADSALAVAPAANDRWARLARLVKARAMLNRGQFANAAAAIGGASAATGVPQSYAFSTYHSSVTESNAMWSLNTSGKRYVVSPAEGTNGLNFRGAADPRLPTNTTGGPNAFDSSTPFFNQIKWLRYDSVVVMGGIEARLIEAEAQYRTDMTSAANRTTVTNMLNAIRTASGIAGLTALAVPATPAAMEDLIFRERAFWMYSTGHRLGDLRRLVRQYGRAPESVYPTGAYHKGGSYGTVYVIPVTFDERNNPNYTGCTDMLP